jgi:hypothetical protein
MGEEEIVRGITVGDTGTKMELPVPDVFLGSDLGI